MSTNITNNGNITVTCTGTNTKNFYIGGVTGGTTDGSNNVNLKNTGNLTFSTARQKSALCLAGVTSYTTGLLTNCENTGNITYHSDTFLCGTFVAGIAGYYASNTMSGCVNKGDVTIEAAAIGGRNSIGDISSKTYNGKTAIAAGLSAGGLVSATGRNPIFENSDNYGKVSVTLNDPTMLKPEDGNAGTSTAARPSVGGLVGDCAGPMTDCNNYGDVNVAIGNGTAFTHTDAGYTFYVGGIVGSGYNFSGPTTASGSDKDALNNFKLTNCNNSGNVYYKSDNQHLKTYHAIGGICGWPGTEGSSSPYTATNCHNSGKVTADVGVKIRVGGVHGGAGRMVDCSNTGDVTIIKGGTNTEDGTGSVIASLAGFQSQNFPISNCQASGTVEAKCDIYAMAGLVANMGNVATNAMDGCSANCTLVGGPEGYTGMVIGRYNGKTKKIVLGSEEDPIEIAGSVNGETVTEENAASYVCGLASMATDKNHLVYYSIGGKAYRIPAPELVLDKLWSVSGVAGVAGWPAYVAGAEDFDTCTRSATFDDEYVYIPKFSTASTDGAFNEATIGMFRVSDGTFAGKVQRTTDPDYMAGTWASTVPVSCARVMKNEDASINGGKDILVVTNLCDAQNVRVYAWENGVNNQPKLIANFSNARRMGDRIAVSGTYQSGRIWYRQSLSQSMTAWLTVTNGKTPEWGFDALGLMPLGDEESMGEFIPFDNGKFGLVPTNTGVGLHLVQGLNEVKLYPDLKRCFGWTPFNYNGVDYLAFLNMAGGTNLPIITVIEGASDTVDNLKATLDAYKVVAQASLATSDPNDLTTTTAYATNNQGDCSVRIIDGVPHIMGMARGGMGIFKFVLQ